ncbi:hypothetical protein NPIL_599811, partial [Nephila pilipes]
YAGIIACPNSLFTSALRRCPGSGQNFHYLKAKQGQRESRLYIERQLKCRPLLFDSPCLISMR